MDIRALGYLAIGAVDLPGWSAFASGVLGVMTDTVASGDLLLRTTTVRTGSGSGPRTPSRSRSGLGGRGRGGPRTAARELGNAGIAVRRDPAAGQDRRVTDLVAFVAPDGTEHELFWGASPRLHPVHLPGRNVRLRDRRARAGHVVLVTEAVDETSRFYMDVMGFRSATR